MSGFRSSRSRLQYAFACKVNNLMTAFRSSRSRLQQLHSVQAEADCSTTHYCTPFKPKPTAVPHTTAFRSSRSRLQSLHFVQAEADCSTTHAHTTAFRSSRSRLQSLHSVQAEADCSSTHCCLYVLHLFAHSSAPSMCNHMKSKTTRTNFR